MRKEFLKIPLSRIHCGKKFTREIFLKLPKNQKMLRIVLCDDEIRPDLFERLQKNENTELYVLPEAGDDSDPEKLLLYATPDAQRTMPSQLIEEEAATALTSIARVAEEVISLAPSPVEKVALTLIKTNPEKAPPEEIFSGEESASIPEEHFSNEKSAPVLVRLSQMATNEDESVNISGFSDAQIETRFAAAKSERPVDETILAGDQPDGLESISIASDKPLFAENLVSGASVSEGNLESSETGSLHPNRVVSNLSHLSPGAATYREMPYIASRLATLLGLSLGYASPTFLADLALSTLLYFSAKNGLTVGSESLSKMNQAALSIDRVFKESALDDSLAIIDFLDGYFQNPECDRTQGSFSKKAFSNTLKSFQANGSLRDEWAGERWRQFVENGPSMNALSLCAKASATAMKASKTMVSERPSA